MTDIVEQAFDAVRRMPPAERTSVAQAILHLAEGSLEEIPPEHMAAVLEGMAQAERGEFAEGTADEIVARAFSRHER